MTGPAAALDHTESRPARPRAPGTATAPAASLDLTTLQHAAGNTAVSRLVQGRAGAVGEPSGGGSTGGQSVAPASPAARTLGTAAPHVRVHTDSPISENPDALARTDGYDIHLAPGAPAPGTDAGDWILAHESAHVVQQTGDGAAVDRDTAELEAEEAAKTATKGGSPGRLSKAAGPHYFEARWHQTTLTNAMDAAGFSDQEQMEAYWTNWCRDVSQAFVPIARDTIGIGATMALLDTVSQMKFGKPVGPALMGMYEPRQHIDNPAGQVSADLIQSDTPRIDLDSGTLEGRPDAGLDPTFEGTDAEHEGAGEGIERKMAVDAAGVPGYINDAKGYILEQIDEAFGVGASGDPGGRTPAGLHAVGNFSHTIQDLFAHSNWVEIAVAKVIEDGEVTFPPADPASDTPEGRLAARLRENQENQQPIIEHFSADVQDAAGNVRPILQTGSFSGTFGEAGHDTLISLNAEVSNLLREHDPFSGPGGGMSGRKWEITTGILSAIDEMGHEGKISDALLKVVNTNIDGARTSALAAVRALPSQARSAAQNVSAFGYQLDPDHPVGGWLRDQIGDVAESGAELVAEAAEFGISELDDAIHQLKGVAKDKIDAATADLDLVGLAEAAKGGMKTLGNAIKDIKKSISDNVPETVARPIINAIDSAVTAVSEAANDWLKKKWQAGVEMVIGALNNTATTDIAQSNVSSKRETYQGRGADEGEEISMEDRLAEIERLRSQVVAGIRAANTGERGEQAINTIMNLPLPQALVYLSSPAYQQLLSDLGAEAARAGEDLSSEVDTAVRIQQIEELPEWAQEGASHSQIAKDHADSPFFGLAFQMANQVDTRLMRLVMQAWTEMQQNRGEVPGQRATIEGGDATDEQGNFSYTGPDTGTEDERTAARERQAAFLDNRNLGRYVIEYGNAAEMHPIAGLNRAAQALDGYLRERAEHAERRARRRGEEPRDDPLAAALAPLLESIRRPDSSVLMQAYLALARMETRRIANPDNAFFSRSGDDWRVANHLSPHFNRIERLAAMVTHQCRPGETNVEHRAHADMHHEGETPAQHEAHGEVCSDSETEAQHIEHAAAVCEDETIEEHNRHTGNACDGETDAEHMAHSGPVHEGESPEEHARHSQTGDTEVFQQRQIDALRGMRGTNAQGERQVGETIDEEFMSAEQVAERDFYIDTETDPRQRMYLEVERIFTHPYDSAWWRPGVVGWCNSHKDLLIQYIDARNRGIAHHHSH